MSVVPLFKNELDDPETLGGDGEYTLGDYVTFVLIRPRTDEDIQIRYDDMIFSIEKNIWQIKGMSDTHVLVSDYYEVLEDQLIIALDFEVSVFHFMED